MGGEDGSAVRCPRGGLPPSFPQDLEGEELCKETQWHPQHRCAQPRRHCWHRPSPTAEQDPGGQPGPPPTQGGGHFPPSDNKPDRGGRAQAPGRTGSPAASHGHVPSETWGAATPSLVPPGQPRPKGWDALPAARRPRRVVPVLRRVPSAVTGPLSCRALGPARREPRPGRAVAPGRSLLAALRQPSQAGAGRQRGWGARGEGTR